MTGDAPSRRARGLLSALGIVSLAVLGLGAGPRDLALSLAVRDPSAGWARALARWGELPALIAVFAAGVLLLAYRGGARDGRPARLDEAHGLARAVLVYAVVHPLALVQAGKAAWGRARPRDLGEGVPFTPWYAPQGGEGESFPSGHAAMGWLFLVVAVWG